MLAWLESMRSGPVELAVRDDLRLWWLGRDIALPDEVVVLVSAVAGGVSAAPAGIEVSATVSGQWAHEAADRRRCAADRSGYR